MRQETRIFWCAAIIAGGGAAILATVWAAQIWGGLAPCPLCLQQRYAYYIGVPLAALVAARAFRQPHTARGLLAPIAVIFALNAALGSYHAGIEYGWWAEPTSCSSNIGGDISTIRSTADLLENLQTTSIVSCATPAFRFLSVSLAGYNALASAALAVLAGLALMTFIKGKNE